MDSNQFGLGIDSTMQLWWINAEAGNSHVLIQLLS